MDLAGILVSAALFIFAPIGVGLIMGIDRKVTAHMQNRVGPPITQAFYDLVKLFGKRPMLMNRGQAVFAVTCLMMQAMALAVLVAGGDLLVVFFVSGAGSVAFVLGAFSARSPYSYFGAQRELLQILAYEPVLLLVILLIGYDRGSFVVGGINSSLLPSLILALLALVIVLVIKLQKSPYDIATAHQEIVSGPYVEYSGPYLAVTKLANWFETAVILGILTLFFWNGNVAISVAGKASIVVIAIFASQIIDNITARLTKERMVKFTLTAGILLVAVNMTCIFLVRQGVL